MASVCVIGVTGMITSGGRGGLERRPVYFVLPENGFSWENSPQVLFLKIVRQGGSLGSTAHSGGADAVIQRQLEKFAPTRQTCGWQRDCEGAVKKSKSPEKEWND